MTSFLIQLVESYRLLISYKNIVPLKTSLMPKQLALIIPILMAGK